ncbi:MAG TPA: sigma-70 family RNA polymerase sigma factor [Anaerolineales bacterium]|nr:sigma-70 family RNA polymerase sigma factor [Anaerolineales bacterium]
MDALTRLPDADLLLRVARGDREAFFQVYDRHASRVLALCRHILGDSMAAEDATQEAFLRVWTRAAQYDPARGKVTTWLLTIARRVSIDRLRSEARRPAPDALDADEAWAEVADPGSVGEDARWHSLRLAMEDLPPEQRRVISLAFYFGLSHSQIAGMLSTPLGTVKTRLRLGMRKLRQAWSESLGSASEPRRRGVRLPGRKRSA